MPELIDADTPDAARTHIGFYGNDYELVFQTSSTLSEEPFTPVTTLFGAIDIWHGALATLSGMTRTNSPREMVPSSSRWITSIPNKPGKRQVRV